MIVCVPGAKLALRIFKTKELERYTIIGFIYIYIDLHFKKFKL